jgi:hypothetical protein
VDTFTKPDAHVGLERLADSLWAERHVVDLLLYKLLGAKYFLAADERRFIALALDEVERAVQMLRAAEAQRSAAIADVAAAQHCDPATLTLGLLASRSPEPYRSVFAEHREAFAALAAEIEETATTNRRLASTALGLVARTLDALAGAPVTTTYTAAGRHQQTAPAVGTLEKVL